MCKGTRLLILNKVSDIFIFYKNTDKCYNKHRWFSGRMLACHAGGPGSIPGRCITNFFIAIDEGWRHSAHQALVRPSHTKGKRKETAELRHVSILLIAKLRFQFVSSTNTYGSLVSLNPYYSENGWGTDQYCYYLKEKDVLSSVGA